MTAKQVLPDEAMRQIQELLKSLGYDGLGAVAVSPKYRNQVNPLEFIPDGWQLVIVPVKHESHNHSG